MRSSTRKMVPGRRVGAVGTLHKYGHVQARRMRIGKLSVSSSLSSSDSPASDASGPSDAITRGHGASTSVARAKEELTVLVAGLDRGFGASATDVARVEAAALKLQQLAGAFHFSCQPYDSGDASRVVESSFMTSRWKLMYSSAFSGGSLGGERPGPLVVGAPVPFPLNVKAIYQDIDYDTKRLDNIVTLALPKPPFPIPESVLPMDTQKELEENATVTLTLSHALKVLPPAGTSIEFIGTSVRIGAGSLKKLLGFNPELDIPELTQSLPEQIRPPSSTRSGTFSTIFIDEHLRVTRGDRRELRVYGRDNPLRCAF